MNRRTLDETSPIIMMAALPTLMAGKLHSPSHSTFIHNDGKAQVSSKQTTGLIALGSIVARSNDNAPDSADRVSLFDDLEYHLSEPLKSLVAAGWITTELTRAEYPHFAHQIYRVWLLPYDVGRRHIDRENVRLRSLLWQIIYHIDVNTDLWYGRYNPSSTKQSFDPWATSVDASLFYMFNTLRSPAPSKQAFSQSANKYVYEAMEDLLDDEWFTGLKTNLYPYQRRSAALMLQREEQTELQLDPRIEQRTAPDGSVYYYNPRDMSFFKEPLYYESCRGGILAETMGLGKTLICLALIISTKDHFPRIPSDANFCHDSTATMSLQNMAIRSIQQKSLPWRVELDRIKHHNQTEDSQLRERLHAAPATYEVPVFPSRWNRNTVLPPPRRLILASTTIVVVPRNLCKQWHSEIQKHVSDGALNVLVMEDLRSELPSADKLRSYDLILFSRGRFEMEVRDGADAEGRRAPPAHTALVCRCPYIGATRERACRCLKPEDVYDSPLKHLHFKRLIIDEGHSFSATNTKAVMVANKLVVADHRWIVSGTPAKDLLGVEVDVVSSDASARSDDAKQERMTSLQSRRSFSTRETESGALKSLGNLASNFLQIRPWYTADSGEPSAVWDEYIYRHEDAKKRTYTSFSTSLQRTLEAMVVKTRPEDVEKDIELPPLTHKVVLLEPSFYDKLTANLFTLVLLANAITSERTDQDYLFHKNSAKPRYQLIANLRQSAFFWTGFSIEDVHASLKNSRGYLEKETAQCSDEDRALLIETLRITDDILASDGWRALSETHELGLYIEDWPAESAEHWSFESGHGSMLTGITQVAEAQKHVNQTPADSDPGDGLAGIGIRSIVNARKSEEPKAKAAKPTPGMIGVPTSSLKGEPILRHRNSPTKANKASDVKLTRFLKASKIMEIDSEEAKQTATSMDGQLNTASPRKRRFSTTESTDLPSDSPFLRSRIIGTTSAKLSYLISQILQHYQSEKILIFYDGDNVAYYIAQMLEVLHIKHEIYAKSLAATLKSEYVVRFDQDQAYRVLLMDVKQAAFGLNVSSASRIYFVNPVCRPNIEAQAIKRAHRIGQTRQVHVETLVLKGTVEQKMHDRAKRMTRSEHADAKVLEDDGGMREIIQSARVVKLNDSERSMAGQMAKLDVPQQVFNRDGWLQALQDATRDVKRRRSGVK